MKQFFYTLYQTFSEAPCVVHILIAFSIGFCVLLILSIFLCDLFFIPLYGVRVPQLPTLYVWHAGISLLISIFKTLHIPTDSFERSKKKYEDDIKKLENIKEHIKYKATLKETVQEDTSLKKQPYKDNEK